MKNKKITEEIVMIIERVYEVGDTEIIIKSVVDLIVKIALQQIRQKERNSLQHISSINYFIQCLNGLSVFPLYCDDENLTDEVSNFPINDINKSRIDNYASNKLFLNDEGYGAIEPQKFIFDYKKGIANEDKKPRTYKKLNLSIRSEDVVRFKSKRNQSPNRKMSEVFETTMNPVTQRKKSFLFNDTNKKNEIIPETIPLDDVEVYEDEKDPYYKDELKGLRNYFKEKELDKIRKEKFSREYESNRIEEEKRLKKYYEDRTLITNNEGKIVKISNLNTESFPGMSNSTVKVRSSEEQLLIQKIKEKDFKFLKAHKLNTMKEKILKKSLQNPVNYQLINYEEIKEPHPELFFQPDPLVSHEIPSGVSISLFEKMKNGGIYKSSTGRISVMEYEKLSSDFGNVKSRVVQKSKTSIKNELTSCDEVEEIKNENTEANEVNKAYIILTTEADEDEFRNFDKNKIVNSVTPKHVLKKSYSRNKLIRYRTNENKEVVIQDTKFQFETLENINDNTVYEKIKIMDRINNRESSFFKTKNMIFPKNHGNKIEELGNLKKYPRERIAFNVMNMTGRFVINNDKNLSKITKLSISKENK